jgi:uncharacterized protein (DUF952 family)
MELIYHVTTKTAWLEALKEGSYSAPSIALEGFIHCSKSNQIEGVLSRYYNTQFDLILLTINPTKLTVGYKDELAPSVNEYFPHIFGPINLDAVVYYEPISGISRKIINASIQLLPLSTSEIAYPIIDTAIEIIKESSLNYQVNAFNTSIDGTYEQIIRLVGKINA